MDHILYRWSAYIVAAILVLIEMAELIAREREILGHLDWKGPDTAPLPPSQSAGNPESASPGDDR